MSDRPSPTVVKVSGSLFDLTDLGPRLHEWLNSLDDQNILLVPGGGPTADAIRHLDRIHRLGEEAAHWLALRALSLNAAFLDQLLGAEITIVDPYVFAVEDERCPDRLPHVWQATSDSIAARVAVVMSAPTLILLKSIAIPSDIAWETAAEKGYVDPIFPSILRRAPRTITVKAINFRELSRMT